MHSSAAAISPNAKALWMKCSWLQIYAANDKQGHAVALIPTLLFFLHCRYISKSCYATSAFSVHTNLPFEKEKSKIEPPLLLSMPLVVNLCLFSIFHHLPQFLCVAYMFICKQSVNNILLTFFLVFLPLLWCVYLEGFLSIQFAGGKCPRVANRSSCPDFRCQFCLPCRCRKTSMISYPVDCLVLEFMSHGI